MENHNRLRALALMQSGLFLLLLLLLLLFGKAPNLILAGGAFALLFGYHLVADYHFTVARIAAAGKMNSYIFAYLLLCTLVVWTTRANEESPLWIVFFVPIIIAAANLNLRGTLITCSAALLLFISHLPTHMYLTDQERVEEFPEMFGFGIMFFMVGILVQAFAEENRRQLDLKERLNEKLLENQEHLKNSLQRLHAAEESLRTKERLASLGEMSAGIAHEIRNPLGIISSSAQMLNHEVASADSRQLLDIIQEESTRLNGLITEFLTFGRQLEPQRLPCDLAAMVTRCLDSLQTAAAQKGVTLSFARRCDPCVVKVDADMIQQVLLNLVLNALDATPRGGRIDIDLIQQGGHIDIVVSDTGCGIPAENLGKIFDPFYTTKGHGTGLGLANSYKIMQSHAGDLQVSSRVGEGSIFTANLPVEMN